MPTARFGEVELAWTRQGDGPPVVLLHGQGGNGPSWSAQSEALAARYSVHALDLRGHGASNFPPGRWTMGMFAADVAALIRSLGLGPCHVVGHSLGGMVALQLALDAPERVRSLAIVNSSAYGHGLWLRTLLIRTFIRLRGMAVFARLNAKLHLPEPGQQLQRERLVQVMGACSPDGYLGAQAAVDGFDVRARLSEIAQPVLIVHSEQDAIALEDKRLIAEKVQHGRLVTISDSRHVVLWDQPERLCAVLLGFLAEQGS